MLEEKPAEFVEDRCDVTALLWHLALAESLAHRVGKERRCSRRRWQVRVEIRDRINQRMADLTKLFGGHVRWSDTTCRRL